MLYCSLTNWQNVCKIANEILLKVYSQTRNDKYVKRSCLSSESTPYQYKVDIEFGAYLTLYIGTRVVKRETVVENMVYTPLEFDTIFNDIREHSDRVDFLTALDNQIRMLKLENI